VTLRDLSRPQWLAALAAARCVTECDPRVEADRKRFRDARQALIDLLPEGTDEREIISQAVHWDAINEVAAVFANLPEVEVIR